MGTQRTKARQFPTGVRPHGSGIQIKFKPRGHKGYCYETIYQTPSPANIEKAGKLRQTICDAIRHGTFRYGDYFPDSRHAGTQHAGTFHHYAQTWLDRPDNNWRQQTRYKFKGILSRVWLPSLWDLPISGIKLSTIIETLATASREFETLRDQAPSQSTYNDWLLCLRGVFDTAVMDGAIHSRDNPVTAIKNKKRLVVEPDPFDDDEREAIIAEVYRSDGDMWGAWFELGFWTGMRYPSEAAALSWPNIDLRRSEARITQIRTRYGIQATTKTGVTRTVALNSRAAEALQRARGITGFKGEWVFVQKNGGPVITGDPQRSIWTACLKRLGIRHRDPYCMRHSYASWGLSNGMNPTFMATQLGHSIEEFFRTYAKWIGQDQNALQIELMERAINKNVAKTGLESQLKL